MQIKSIYSLSQNLLFVLLFGFEAGNISAQSISTWEHDLLAHRQAKDSEFYSKQHSPLDSIDLYDFQGLSYFPPDSNFRVTAQLVETPYSGWFEMATSTSRRPLYRIFGWVHFHIQGNHYQLAVYQNKDLINKAGFEDYLFLPFTDFTNGSDSYGGGRYLELTIPQPGEQLILDFNLAYNPYCAYSHRYSCPLVPTVNHIPFSITAGEMNFHGKGH